MKLILRKIYNKIFPKSVKGIFKRIYDTKGFGSSDSISGPGSNLEQTKTIIEEIPKLFRKYGILSVLDAPCGDFHWMQHVDLRNIKYTGWDIVEKIITINNAKFRTEDIIFESGDILSDKLAEVDLILCRDCLVHFSFAHINKFLINLKSSNIKYLLTTTFTNLKGNDDIDTGEWRPLNLVRPPFNFPNPLVIINEKCTEMNGKYSDKSLGMWKVSDIPLFGK